MHFFSCFHPMRLFSFWYHNLPFWGVLSYGYCSVFGEKKKRFKKYWALKINITLFLYRGQRCSKKLPVQILQINTHGNKKNSKESFLKYEKGNRTGWHLRKQVNFPPFKRNEKSISSTKWKKRLLRETNYPFFQKNLLLININAC